MVEKPGTGECLIFQETSADSGGAYVRFETIVRPGGTVAAAHVHPYQTERFDVLAGTLGVRTGRRKAELRAGESVEIEPGIPHKFWNAGDDELRFVAEVSPALQFESLIETMFALAADGKTSLKGMPNPLRLAVIANHHFDVVRLPLVPGALQKAALACGAPLGRLLGYGPVYEPAGQVALA